MLISATSFYVNSPEQLIEIDAGALTLGIISMRDLTKAFGNVLAVDHLNLDIEEGEIFGLLGPNGAGKSTTILMLATVMRPTGGTATVGEYDIKKNPEKVRSLLGLAFQEPKMLWVSTPWDVVNFHAKICGLSGEERKRKVKEVLEMLEMWEFRHRTVHALSGGMRKRVEIAKVLIQEPKVAIVDEPTAQIDVVGKHKIWNMLRGLCDSGTTIILATNELYEADMLSDRVGILYRGKLLVCDTPKKLKDSIPGGDIIDIRLEKDVTMQDVEALKDFEEVADIHQLRANDLRLHLNKVEEVVPRIMNFFMTRNLSVSSIRMSEPSLDDVFSHFTGLTIEEAQKESGA
jgi:ABC-2 type transport system ATP-binding protein